MSDSGSSEPQPQWSPSSSMPILRLALSTAALCMCTLIHAFVLISVFPYSGYMALHLLPDLTPEQAGPYAGLLASSFMAGRTLSSYPWGTFADIYGRKPVLIASLALSATTSLLFGLSSSWTLALVWRFLLGLSNGIVGTAKTVVSELAAMHQQEDANHHKNDTLETRMMGLVIGMRAWGFLVSPAIGGFLAEPLVQYPGLLHNYSDNQRITTFLRAVLTKYPFLLPNLVGAVVCMCTAIIVAFCIEETLPSDQQRSLRSIPGDVGEFVANSIANHCGKRAPGQLRKGRNSSDALFLVAPGRAEVSNGSIRFQPKTSSYNSIPAVELSSRTNLGLSEETTTLHATSASDYTATATIKSLWQRPSTQQHLLAYFYFSFLVVSIDEAFPLFCISTKGGLGVSEALIGQVLSLAGLVFAALQYIVYVATVERFGLYPSLSIGCLLGILPIVFIPISLLLQDSGGSHNNRLGWLSFLILVIITAGSKIFVCIFFTSMAIAMNKTVEASQRAALNGLAMVGGSIAKGLGPIFAGFLVAASFSSVVIPAKQGSIVIFTVLGALGVAILLQLLGLQLPQQRSNDQPKNLDYDNPVLR